MSGPSLWSSSRRSGGSQSSGELRTPFEIDHDRLLFSTPVRRLADKTQVFPLEKNDGVRTRLTHSYEVSNVARSLGNRLIRIQEDAFGKPEETRSAAPVILAAVGLAHDLGNPPFGHQGEAVIGRWFERNARLFDHPRLDEETEGFSQFQPVPPELRNDFYKFEGNAQTVRLISRLQNTSGPFGLDLTAATLAALMKYSVDSNSIDKKSAGSKKYGYFESESDVMSWVRDVTGLKAGQRHPLTWIMEASDDTAYSALDVEDAMRKGIVAPEQLLSFLRRNLPKDGADQLVDQLGDDFDKADSSGTSLSRASEIKASYARTRIIDRLVKGSGDAYLTHRAEILDLSHTTSLLDCDSDASKLYSLLKKFAKAHAYNHTTVLRTELEGAIVLDRIMTCLWKAITDRPDFLTLDGRRQLPQSIYAYSLISDSYRWNFENNPNNSRLPIRYREMQLLTDMVSGMTDGFAMDLAKRLEIANHD